MDRNKISFSAANSLPLKICVNRELIDSLEGGIIRPVHAQVIPTNRCNLNCGFCSCSKRGKNLELPLEDVYALTQILKEFGCQAVTITGGGEPLMHPDIDSIIRYFHFNSIEVGLVTNGILLARLDAVTLSALTWCRISCSDERKFTGQIKITLQEALCRNSSVDWAFSYVVSNSDKFDPDNLAKYVAFAESANSFSGRCFTHIRVVADLINIEHTVSMDEVKKALSQRGIKDQMVIYQGRKIWDAGEKDCFISLLKPVIGADGYVYPCCGVQYAREKSDLDMAEGMRMGHWRDLMRIYTRQEAFDGRQCVRCYYKNYNEFLGIMKSDIDHRRFV